MKVELVASDLDGTLLRTDGKVADRTRAAVHRIRNAVPFVIATGRPPRWVHPVAEDLEHHQIAVCSNGAITVDLSDDGRVVDSNLLSAATARDAVSAVLAVLPDVAFAVDSLSGFAHTPNYIPKWELPPDVRVAPIFELLNEPCLKVLFRHRDMDQSMLDKLIGAVGDSGSITYGASGPAVSLADTLIEIMSPGVSKAAALQRYCEVNGIDPKNTVAFGDMPNDFEMIKWAGHGVAMANGHPELKRVAQEVALSNDEHGVARILDRLIPSH
jgi:hydroxymethylpyrimidine pyrophosphatase-like HAD family hydrolase